jgi:hypothetical protein
MTAQKGLLELTHRLVSDEDLRNQLAMAPKETLIAELGISREDYEALKALVPVVLAGGLFVLGGGTSPEPGDLVQTDWGSWGA